MYHKILLCYDGTREGRRALRQGADIAIAMKAQAFLLAISRSMLATAVPEGVTPELVSCEEQTARALLEEGVNALKERGVTAEGDLVFGDPHDRIPETARRIGADLIVLGYRPRSRLARWWSQSKEETLLSRVSCSVLVAMESETE